MTVAFVPAHPRFPLAAGDASMTFVSRLSTTILVLAAILFASPDRSLGQSESKATCECSPCRVEASCRCGRWYVAQTANFQACSLDSEESAKLAAQTAEKLRSDLRIRWLADESKDTQGTQWSPKCQIVVHSNQPSYVAAVGRGSERTVGSSLITVDKGRII